MIKRFRREVRSRSDIVPFATVTLCDDPARAANTRAATLLLKEIFADRITILYAPDGIICGSQEEHCARRLAEYTQGIPYSPLLLSSVSASEIENYLSHKDGKECTVFIPDSAEVRFVRRLGEEFPDVLFGL